MEETVLKERTLARALIEYRRLHLRLRLHFPNMSDPEILLLSSVVEQAQSDGMRMRLPKAPEPIPKQLAPAETTEPKPAPKRVRPRKTSPLGRELTKEQVKQKLLQALRSAMKPLTAHDLAGKIGVGNAQRLVPHLNHLLTAGVAKRQMRDKKILWTFSKELAHSKNGKGTSSNGILSAQRGVLSN
jgi:hypothetical protein